jgi:hypothetical protein
MNLIFHIGRHKSGTSSLQHWMHINRNALKLKGLIYPESGLNGGVAHHMLAQALHPKSLNIEIAQNIGLAMRDEASESDTIIISSEAFQNITGIDALLEFRSLLGVSKENTRVICYLREHLDYAMSAYRQKIHNQAATVAFTRYAEVFSDLSGFFSRWREVGNLELAWFSRKLLAGGNIIEDFCNRVGMVSNDYSMPNKNVSIGGNLLVLKLASNLIGQGDLSYGKLALLAEEYERFSMPFYLSDDWCERSRNNSSYNKSIIKELGPPPFFQSWSHCKALPDLPSLNDDISIFCECFQIANFEGIYNAAFSSKSFFIAE